MFKCLQEWIAASGAVNCPCCSEDGPLVSSHVRRAPDCSRDIKAGDYEGHDCVPSLTPEEEKQAKIRGIVSGGEASALIQKEVLILSEEERRSLLDKAGISSSIELGAAQLKSSGICLAGEERMRHISSQIVGDNLKGEIAPFSFPIPSGGEEIKGAPLVYIPQLVDKVVQLLEGNERTGRLTWHEGFIPANEIWLKIGGDKGGGTFKMTFQILFVAGDSITNLHVAPDRFKDQVEHLHGMKWRQYTVKVFICGLRVPVKDVWLVRSQCDQMATPLIVRGHAKERSLEDTCADHQCYVSSGSVKKDAQMFFNCISEPIFDIPVSQVCPPGLHIMLGIFTKMFHLLEALCCQLDLELTSQTTPPVFPSTARCCKGFHCSKQTLKLPSMHMKCCSRWQHMCGLSPRKEKQKKEISEGTCTKHPDSVHIYIREMAQEKLPHRSGENFIDATQAHALDLAVQEFMAFFRDTYPEATVPIKMHLLEDHTSQWANSNHVGFGLLGEQGAESIHAKFNQLGLVFAPIKDRVQNLKCIVKEHLLSIEPQLVLPPLLRLRE
eukprot:Em0644g1a